MKHRARFAAVSLAWAVIATINVAVAQPQTMPAPDWAIWRAFHHSLEFYSREFPLEVESLFGKHGGLTKSEATAVMGAGRGYLDALRAIDEVARTEVQGRIRTNGAPSLPSHTRPAERRPAAPPQRPEINRMQSQLAALAFEGFFDRVQLQQEAALEAHRQQLTRAIGAERLLALDEWIEAEVAPNVRTISSGTAVRSRTLAAP